MKKIEIFDDEDSISIEDNILTTSIDFSIEAKEFEVSSSIKDDCYLNKQKYQYKISTDPIEVYIRLLESSSEPPLVYSVKDGVVLKEDKSLTGEENTLKKEVEWNKVVLASSPELLFFILSRHPEVISRNEYRRFLRQTYQRIRLGLTKIEEMLKEKDDTGLEISEGDYGNRLWYTDGETSEKILKKRVEYVENNFKKPLFSEKSSDYCGLSEYEFQESSSILRHIDYLLSEKEKSSSEIHGEQKKNYWHWVGYIWTVIVNLITIGVVVAIYDKIYESFEIIIVSILVLIYLSVQSLLMTYGSTTITLGFALDTEFKNIKKLLGKDLTKSDIEKTQEAKKEADKSMVKMYINATFLFIIYLIALYYLFGAF
ncbi:hypothetical protein COY05_00570 [Candidatus Peregrinibacteria bacterium CG_4_10_14_0_2_um_filter_38_24]|nr:MAG: hypothetical protein COY05_00570 [Candidatus Peregrinibacteria bacterium CG_4_10_14_0_2_um_filter_38_24]